MTNETTNNEPKIIAREDVPERPDVFNIGSVLTGVILVALTGPFGGGFTLMWHYRKWQQRNEWDQMYGHAFEDNKKVEVV